MIDIVLVGLTNRRAYLYAEIQAADAALRKMLTDLDHLDAAIRLYDAGYKAPKVRISRAKRVEFSRLALDLLREAKEPMLVRDITLQIMRRAGMDATDRRSFQYALDKVRVVLSRQRHTGTLRSIPAAGQLVLWEVAKG